MTQNILKHVAWLILILAVLVRLKAALELRTDFDEPVYVTAGEHYARALREGDLTAIVEYDDNLEHPILVKLLYGGGIALLGPDASPQDRLTVSRLISVLFGTATVALVTGVEPLAGLALALHTMHTKYTSQAYLEALPAFASALCVLAYARSQAKGRRDRWFWLSAVALGVTAASKYIYVVAGLVILGWLLWDVKRQARRVYDPLLFGLTAALVFLALNPILWTDPLGRLLDSVFFHGGYITSAEVARYNYAWWKPLDHMAKSWPTLWHPGVFFFAVDELVFVAGLLGLGWFVWRTRLGEAMRARLSAFPLYEGLTDQVTRAERTPARARLEKLILSWFVAGLLFLLIWPTKWPQYTLVTVTPLCLTAGLVAREALNRLRQREAYWGKTFFDLFPHNFWPVMGLLALVFMGALTVRSVMRHAQLRGWRTFDRDNSSLPSNIVHAVTLDTEGRLWIGTAHGAAVLKLEQNLLNQPQWTIYDPDNSDLVENDVLDLTTGPAGEMWMGTPHSLSCLDTRRERWISFTPANSPLPSERLNAIAAAPDGSVWIATDGGAVVLNRHEDAESCIDTEWAWQVYDTSNSGLLNDAVLGLAVQTGTVPSSLASLSKDDFYIWFATNRGASSLDVTSGTWVTYTSDTSGLAWDGVSNVAVDAAGRVWLTTFGRGISVLYPDGQWQTFHARDSDLPWGTAVLAVAGCQCGERPAWVWFGADVPGAAGGRPLAAYEPPPNERWHTFGQNNSGMPGSAVSDVAVQCLADPKAGATGCAGKRIWIATRGMGIAVYDMPD